jgi:hypothetical protein
MGTEISNICQKCADCCKDFPYVEVTRNEIYTLEQMTGLHFDEFTNGTGLAFVRGYRLKTKENGDCIFLNNTDYGYACSVYEARPRICREYPSKNEQKEFCLSKGKNFCID